MSTMDDGVLRADNREPNPVPVKKVKLSQDEEFSKSLDGTQEDLIRYAVVMDLLLVDEYYVSNKPLKPLFVEVMQVAGSSESHISSHGISYFFADLTKEQANKLCGDHRVMKVRPEYVYETPKIRGCM